jgi:hypothetical protein
MGFAPAPLWAGHWGQTEFCSRYPIKSQSAAQISPSHVMVTSDWTWRSAEEADSRATILVYQAAPKCRHRPHRTNHRTILKKDRFDVSVVQNPTISLAGDVSATKL